MSVNPIPAGFRTITPYLVVDNAAAAIDFYKRAFGAKEIARMDGPPGKIGHAELKIGDSILMLSDEMPGSGNRSPKSLGGSPVGIMLYLEDVDAAFKQATAAGAKVDAPPADMFWGDRYGKITDPFGHSWSLATHKEDVTPAEMNKRMKDAMSNMGQTSGAAG
jgi:PhnB protein